MLETRQPEFEQGREPSAFPYPDNAAALEFVYQRYRHLIFSICLRILRDPVQAEDAAQDVYVRLLLKIHTFRGDAAFSSWLYRVTTNLVLMGLRKHDRNGVSLSDFGDGEDGCERGVKKVDSCLSGVVDRIDIQAAIDLLSDHHRSVLVLHDVQGYGHKEIAQLFGYSVSNAKRQLHKARKRLRTLLSGRLGRRLCQRR